MPVRPRSPVADVTFIDVRRLQAEADAADVALAMDEDAFRAFYDRTAGALWGYLSRTSGDRQVADDLLQESYYRLLKSSVPWNASRRSRMPTCLNMKSSATILIAPSFFC